MSDLPKPIAATWARSTLISAVTAGLMILGVALSAPASAAPQPGNGEIVGTITEVGTGAPVSPANVDIYRAGARGLAYYDSVPANSSGGYYADLQPGTYRVCFSDVWWTSQTHVPTCFGGDSPESATDIVLAAGATEVANGELELRPTISGTVTGPGGTPLAGIEVTSQFFFAPHNHFHWTDFTTTQADGTYTVAAEPGESVISFSSSTGEYRAEFWDDQASEWTANEITVSAGQAVTGKDAVLARTAGISGTVTLPEGALRGDKRVRIIDPETGAVASSAAVAANGSYTAWGLEAGTYRVEFARVSGAAISAAEFFDGAAEATPGAADLITLGAHELRSGIDASLSVGGTVTGKLLDTHGAPLEGCEVEVHAATGDLISRFDETDSNGDFVVTGLSAGARLVQVHNWTGDCDGGVQFYDGDETLATEGGAAESITATLGGTSALGVLTYARGAAISGTLTLPEGALTNDRRVRLVDQASGDSIRTIRAGSDGAWSFEGLEAGSYRLEFSRISGQALAAAEFYDDIAEQAGTSGARVFEVGLGDVETGVNAGLAVGGALVGVLHSSHGETLPYCYVQAYTADGRLVTRGGYTDEAGAFSVGGLSTGDYLLKVDASRSESCDGGDKYAVGSGGAMSNVSGDAVPFSVTRGAVTDLDAPLVYTRGGRVEGTVELPAGATRVDTSVRLLDAETGEVVVDSRAWRENVADGNTFTYFMSGLPTGSYKLSFGRLSGVALSAATFHDGVAQGEGFGAGDTINVTAGETTSLSPASAPIGSTLSGKVVNGDGAGILGCVVQAFTMDNRLVTRSDRTDDTGVFTVTGLSAGDYLLRVAPGGGCRGGLQYRQSGTGTLSGQLPAADPVTVPATGNTEIAQALVYADGVSISGTITVPVALNDHWVPISLVDVATGDTVDGTWVGATTQYSFRNLAPSTYRVEIARDSLPTMVAAAFYDNVDEGAGADAVTEITVEPGVDLGGVDQTLKVGGTLDATLVDGEGSPEETCSLTAHRPDGTLSSRDGFTMTDGEIWLKGLTTGDYRLAVECGGVTRHYTGGSHLSLDEAEAETFHATLGQPATIQPQLVFGDAPVPPVENTEVPAISDTTPQVGQTLTATAGTWNPEPDSTTFQWIADGEPIGGATESTYAVTAADLGSKLSVEVSAVKADHTTGTATSPETTAVAPGTIANTAAPAIDDTTPEVGDTLTATAGTWSPTAGSTAFQWLADGEPIDGATESTYTVVTGDIGTAISVEVTASKDGYASATEASDETAAVVGPDVPFAAAPVPTITGTVKVGETLTAHTGEWDPQPTFSYQWLSNGQPIAGATSSTYTLKAAETFTAIQVGVVGTKDGYDDTTRISAGTEAVAPGQIANNSPATISGAAVVGSTLTAGNGTWTPSPTSYLYQWHANGQPIAGATGPTFTVPASLAGQAVQVGVVAQREGYHAGASVSAGVPIAQAQPLAFVFGGEPRMVGINRVRRVLSYVAPSISPAPAAVSYQWMRNGAPIAGATNARYRVRRPDRRKVISLRVTYARAGYATVVKVTNGKRIR